MGLLLSSFFFVENHKQDYTILGAGIMLQMESREIRRQELIKTAAFLYAAITVTSFHSATQKEDETGSNS